MAIKMNPNKCEGTNNRNKPCGKLKKQGRFCWNCAKMDYARRNPAKYAFQCLKGNARRRGKEFNLTFEQFFKFAIETEYLNKRGRSRKSYHIDRINPAKGYEVGNIQILTNEDNLKKRFFYEITGNYNWTIGEMEFHTKVTNEAALADYDEGCGF